MTPLRGYQSACLDRCRAAYRDGAHSILIVSPTGSGKTRMGAEFALQHIARGGRRVLWLAHRRELVRQAADRLRAEGLASVRVLQADADEGPADARTLVASTQTLVARGELPDASLLVTDEARHYVSAPEWNKIAEAYRGVPRLGLDATPIEGMGAVFDALVVAASVRQLTEQGHLVRCDVIAPARHVEEGITGTPLEAYQKHAPRGRAVVFCANVRHAQETAEDFQRAGIAAECVDGDTDPDVRERALERFRTGELQVLTNVFVLTEGWDCPEADTCIIARGCGSTAMFLQAVGRVLRPAPGKARALLLDLRGAVHVHGMPDDDREYSLQGRAIRKADALPTLTQCRACGAVYRSRPTCIRCGARLPPPKLPRSVRGDLSQIFATEPEDRKREYLRRLHAEAKVHGHKPGWAAFRFKAKYGHWPSRSAA